MNSLSVPLKKAVPILALALLGLSAGPALSQSMEYRRGYDQGYRDGAEASTAQAQSAASAGRITVVTAQYGIRGVTCDARDSLQQAAGRRRYLGVTVDNNLCGDPAPKQPKRLFITYRCGDGPELRVAGPEKSVLVMNCR
jgi:hypothetical protein